MKDFFIRCLEGILAKLARLTLMRFRPLVIGVTGSVGKTSTRNAIAGALAGTRTVRSSVANFNTEIGLALSIVSSMSPEEMRLVDRDHPAGTDLFKKMLFWGRAMREGVVNLLPFVKVSYPNTVVLEYGADRPGDIRRLLKIARPSIAVITALGDIPVHVEHYDTIEDVVREKARLLEQLPSGAHAVLNADDERVIALADRTRAHVMTYGFSKNALVQISGYEIKIVGGVPYGISFKLGYGGSFVPVVMPGVFGRAPALSAAAAAAVGLILGMNLVRISEGLRRFTPAPSRFAVMSAIRDALLIDDSYNASPLSVKAALETLAEFPAKRRIAVLGDMLELGSYSMEAHEGVGAYAATVVDVLVVVGSHAKFIAERALSSGMDKKSVRVFETVEEASDFLFEFIKKGDAVLVKASHGMEFARIVEAIREQVGEIENVNSKNKNDNEK